MRLIRTETFLRYARMKIQEAEEALAEEELDLSADRCRDAALCLLKATAAASHRWKGVDLGGSPPADVVAKVLGEFLEGAELRRCMVSMERVLGPRSAEVSRREAEELLSITGELFTAIHQEMTR